MGQGPHGRVAPLFHEVGDQLAHPALPEAHDLEHAQADLALEAVPPAQVGNHPVDQEVFHLPRHAGQRDHAPVADLHDEGRRRADGVFHGDRARGDERLAAVRG